MRLRPLTKLNYSISHMKYMYRFRTWYDSLRLNTRGRVLCLRFDAYANKEDARSTPRWFARFVWRSSLAMAVLFLLTCWAGVAATALFMACLVVADWFVCELLA